MQPWIALLRGINVGGKNILPMAELVQGLRSLQLDSVKTYIQSGNAVFRASIEMAQRLDAEIADMIEDRHGFRPRVLVLSADDLAAAVASNPFPEAEGNPKTLHLSFLAANPSEPDLESLAEAAAPNERFCLTGRIFYLHAPDGIGRSKLATKVEHLLGVATTARNWRTVNKLHEMAKNL